jgi:hypothetical protein
LFFAFSITFYQRCQTSDESSHHTLAGLYVIHI